jgi:hypothetical protein
MTRLIIAAALALGVAACTSSGSATGAPSFRSYDSGY